MATKKKSSTPQKSVKIGSIRLQQGTDRTLYVTWSNGKGLTDSKIDHYEVQWYYRTNSAKTDKNNKVSIWFPENSTTTKNKAATYNAPNNALCVFVAVTPVAKTHKVTKKDSNGKDKKVTVPYFKGKRRTTKGKPYKFSSNVSWAKAKIDNDIVVKLGPHTSSSADKVRASWTWDHEDTAGYDYDWGYATWEDVEDARSLVDGNILWSAVEIMEDSSGQTENKYCVYSVPAEAYCVFFRIKPYASLTVNGLENWETEVSQWKRINVSSLEPDVPDAGKPKDIKIGLQTGSTNTLYATWKWSAENTENYDFEWQYSTGDGIWFEGSSGNSTLDNTLWSYPENAKQVRFRVKAISETQTIAGKDIDYWTSDFSKWTYKKNIQSLTPTVKEVKGDYNVNVRLQAGTSNVLYATWVWKQKNTENYQFEWQYNTNPNEGKGVWMAGQSGTATLTNCTYNVPSNAEQVRFRVQAFASGSQWTTTRSGWSTVKMASYRANVSAAKKISIIRLNLQTGSADTLYATWTWNKNNISTFAHVKEFHLRWEYDTGDNVWFSESESTVDGDKRVATYSVPSNAIRVRVGIKPVADTHTVYGQEVEWWTCDWSEYRVVKMSDFDPEIPQLPAIKTITITQQNGSDDTLIGTWDGQWDREHTESFECEWVYTTGNGQLFPGKTETITPIVSGNKVYASTTYQMPSNALTVRLRVRPIAETHSVHAEDVPYWEAPISGWGTFSKTMLRPTLPEVPSVTITGNVLRAEVNVYGSNATDVEFQVVSNDTMLIATGSASIVTNHAAYECQVAYGSVYKVRCRGVMGTLTSDWTQYSSNVGTGPATPARITEKTVITDSSVRIAWEVSPNAEGYEVEYANNIDYFDASSEVSSVSVTTPYAVITGLDSGYTWYFRVKATNSNGDSGWTDIVSVILGRVPSIPTTWSETVTAMVGTDVILYWVHNSEDDSSETGAEIELTIGGTTTIETYIDAGGEATDTIHSFVFSTSGYTEGAKLLWRVRTKGILDDFSDWSIIRAVDIYSVPVLAIGISSTEEGDDLLDTIETYPFYVLGDVSPVTQEALGYSLSIISNESYAATTDTGENHFVNAGEQVFYRYYNAESNSFVTQITPGDVNLETGTYYTIQLTVSLDSGLVATASADVYVSWEEEDLSPEAELSYDDENLCMYILPFCDDPEEEGTRLPNILLSVYRIENDGTLTEIRTGISNSTSTTIIDPHPSLDYARYRIVAESQTTGSIGYSDIDAYEVGEKAIIIQWGTVVVDDESDYDIIGDPMIEGSVVRLPFNVDVSDAYSPDVELIEYIGRAHPVSYYGTQIGFTSSFTADVPSDDIDTIYALRRLARYGGDVYVREPYGSGYWAHVEVSFQRKHNSSVIPVSLRITRVEGGA